MTAQPKIHVVPLTLVWANRYVSQWHRHHEPIPGHFAWFSIGAIADGTVRGAAIAGRPTNRNNDDGQTVEVLRVATDGTPNAPSALLGACRRAASAMGAARVVTYTLDEETGASLRGAGWVREADGIVSKWHRSQQRPPSVYREHLGSTKVRWAVTFREPIPYAHVVDNAAPLAQDDLFGGVV